MWSKRVSTSLARSLELRPIPVSLARQMVIRHHYLHSLPGGARLCLGVFLGPRLAGVVVLGVGPFNAHLLVDGAIPDDCLTLTRLWLSDELPRNSESRVIGLLMRNLRRHTRVKFLLSYADPAQGHLGIIYQATNWVYTGLSQAMPRYALGDGKPRHSRSFSHCFGTHSLKHFAQRGVALTVVEQSPKHRYVFFIDARWRGRLTVPSLPYPKFEEHANATDCANNLINANGDPKNDMHITETGVITPKECLDEKAGID